MSPKRNIVQRLGDALGAFQLNDSERAKPSPPAQRSYGGIYGGGGYDDAAYLASYYETRTIPRTDTGLAAAFAISVWAYRATSVRASMVGSVPWVIKNVETGEVVDKSSNVKHTHPLAKAIKGVKLIQDFGLFELWEYSLCIWGESFFEKLRTPLDFYPPLHPTGFYWLNPIDVTPFAPFGEIETITYIGTNANGRVVQLDRDEFILSRYFNPLDITTGISPLEVALTDINVEANAKAFAKTFFRNNARPGLIFYPKADGDVLTAAQIDQMRRLINEQWSGVNNAGKPQILNAPVDVKTLDSQSLDDQSDSTERLSRDILAAFGVPRSLAGDTDSAQYKANDDVMRWFIETTIQPECVRIADTVNTHMLPFFDKTGAFIFEFDFSKYEVVTEADKAKQDLNAQRLNTTAMTLHAYQKASGIDNPNPAFEDLWIVPGFSGYIPTAELPNLWKLALPAPMPAPYPPFEPSPLPTPPAPIAEPVQALVIEPEPTITLDGNADAEAQADTARAAQRCLDEFESYATFVRNGKHTRRAFTWSHVDDDTAYLMRADLEGATDASTRGASIIAWRVVMSARAGISPDVLSDAVLPPMTRLYRDELTSQTAEYRAHLTEHGLSIDIEAATRAHYLTVMSQRGLTSDQAGFEREAYRVFKRAQDAKTKRPGFETALFNLVEQYSTRTILSGYADGGYKDYELIGTDKAWLSDHMTEQRAFISNVAAALYADERLTDDEIIGKPGLWWRMSVLPAYNYGLRRASANALGKFGGVNGVERCRDCAQLYGKVRPFSEWFAYFGRKLPPCSATECGGWQCFHLVEPTSDPLTPGKLPPLFGASRSVLHIENMEALQS